MYGAVSLIAGIYQPRKEGIEIEVASFTVSPSDLLAASFASFLSISCSAELEVLVQKGGIFPPEDTAIIPLTWKSLQLWALCAPDQQTKKRGSVLAGIVDPDYPGERGLLLHDGGMGRYVWNTSDFLRCALVLPFPKNKVSRKLQQPNPGWTINGLDPVRKDGLGHSSMQTTMTS